MNPLDQMIIPLDMIRSIPNDKELGEKIREIYWQMYNEPQYETAIEDLY